MRRQRKRRPFVACAVVALTMPLGACPGYPVGSISDRPGNIYDEALQLNGPADVEEVVKVKLTRLYPPGSGIDSLLSYLRNMGSDCASLNETTHICRMSSYFEERYAYWFFNVLVARGGTLERVEYKFETIIETSKGRVKSIDVSKSENPVR